MRTMRNAAGIQQDSWDHTLAPPGCSPPAISPRFPRIACLYGSPDPDALLPIAARLTPRIERHPNALVLDLTGSEHLLLPRAHHEGAAPRDASNEAATWPLLAERLAERLHHHLAATARDAHDAHDAHDAVAWRVGLAPSRTIAWLAAHTNGRGWCAVIPQEAPSFLGPLPVQVLPTLPDLAGIPEASLAVAALAQGGITTLGHLARLAPAALEQRFGALGLALLRLATGHDRGPLRITPAPAWLGARLPLDPPLALNDLANALNPLATFLARALRQRRQEADAVALVVAPERGPTWRVARHLGHATTSRGALLDHAHWLLGQIVAGLPLADGAAYPLVCAVHLRVGGLRPARPQQTTFWRPPLSHQQRLQRIAQQCATGDAKDAKDALRGHSRRPRLCRAVLTSPHAVLPEDRYTCQPHHAP